nr:MAG TPA: crystallin beta/gamma motif-containing protein [Caudoviricetes sp.]
MDPQKRTEIEQMMRRDVASGNIGVKIKMPGENNSDELNDIPNYAPTSEYATYDTGRRDDAGNPIMSSDVMDLMMTKSYEPQKESDWSVSNIVDAVYTKLRDNFYDGSVQPIDFDNPYYTKDMTAPLEPITGKDLIKGVVPESFQASKLYADYFYGEDEKREQIKKAHDLTGIRAETIANDPDVWEKVMKIVQRAEKLKKVPGMLDASGDLNMRRVYEAMPYLKEIVEKRGTNEAVMMLNNAEGLQTVNDAYSNEFMRFAGSVATGVERGYYNIRKQMTYANAMIGRRKLTEDEQNWITALDKKKDELPEYSYGGVGQTVGAMIGGAAENIPMIASAQGIGAIAGGIALAATKNPGTAANVGRAAAIAVMGLEIGGGQYEENLSKLDAKGRAMYTPTQAAALSATQGLAEGVIEQLALQKIARTIFGRGEAKSLRDLYAGAGAKDLALAAEGATANEAARTLIKERILGAAKAGAITFNTELQEEFAQQVSDMVIENMAQMALKGDDAEISSVRKILQKSTAAVIEAAPSIMGFGLIGFGGHVGAHTNTMLGARAHMENLIKDRLYRSVNENQHLMNTVEAVGDNLKNVQELQGKAPDLVNEMLDSQNRRYGMETTSVDIVSLNQEEGGAELVQEIAAANNISAEELQACADGTGMLPVKTSTLQQMTTHLDESKRKALFQNITKSSDLYTDKQAQHEAKIVKEILGAFREKTEEEVGDSVDRYVESAFAEYEHRALARDILLADVNHPAAEIKRRMNRLDSDLAELTAVQSDGGAESAEYLAHIQPEIDKINAQKGALEAVAGTIKSLQHGDVVATAELSPEARGVYHELAGQLGNAKSKKARTAARASALLAARYADRMAKVYSEVQGKPYTAADYMREHLRVDARADDKKREAAKKKAEVVKDFIDTHFPDAAEREMAVIATMQDAVSPAKGWRRLYNDFVEDRDELLRPALDALGRGMGNGVDIVPIDDDGRGIRVSNNEPWYRYFYKEHGRPPRKGELTDLAYRLTVGDASAPKIEGWAPASQEDIDAMEAAKGQLDELNGYIHTLENIKERMMQMDTEALNQDEAQTGVFGDREKAIAVREIRNLVPLEVVLTGKPLDKKAAEAVFSTFGEVENPRYGTYATFPKSMVGKIIKHRGLDVSQMLTDIPRLFSSSVLALVEPEYKKEGHKEHPNILAYHHYVNKFTADGTTYYIRFSLREEKTKNRAKPSAKRILHSTGISDIQIYEENKKDVSSQRIRVSDPGEESKTSFVDHRLAELFDSVKDIPADENAETLEQSAWHGTPHDFREFLLEMIGTGEGAQTHGWGLYFAQNREVSEWYKDVLGEVQQAIIHAGDKTYAVHPDGYRVERNSGKPLKEGSSIEIALSAFEDSNANVKQAIRETEEYLERMERIKDTDVREKNKDLIREALKILQEEADTWNLEKKKSSLFHVEIPDNDVLLDEQKPFDEQPQFVQEKLREVFADEDNNRKARFAKEIKSYEAKIKDYDLVLSENATIEERQAAAERLIQGGSVYGVPLERALGPEFRQDFQLGREDVEYYKEQTQEALDNYQTILKSYRNGKAIYESLSYSLGSPKAASLALNEVGIKGITYDGQRDGRCFVIFDDQAIQIIEKYNQDHAHGAKGNITATLGGTQRLISLMQVADQSTFMHEMAHNFLFDLEHIAEVAPESRYAKDLAAIQKWATWTKGAADEYVGTASAAEFRNREEKILAAEKKGDAAETERLKREWMQERFARGFEEYLRSGEAPAQGLRAVFRRFKAWLTRIYKDVTGAGVRASAEVEAIMARMIATDEEIEAAAVVKRAQRLQKIDPELLNADSAETMIQWETEAKERAKETLLKELIREMQGRDVDAHMEEYEAQLKAEMRENPVWQAEAVAETFGVGQVIASGYYPTVESYEKALKDAGGGFDAAYNRQMREERERYKTEMPNAEAIAQRAEEVLASQEYTARQTALEGELLNEYIKAYDNAPQRLKDAMIGVARALEREEDAPLEKAVTALKYAFRWQEKQAQEIDDLRALLSSAKESGEEDRTKMREKFGEAFNRLKLSAAQNLEAVRSLRDSAAGRVAAMRAYAQQHLENAPTHEATNTRHWMRQVQSAAKETERHLTNMLRKNNGIEKEDTGDKDLAAARTAKTRQLAMEAMTHESVKLKRELDRMVKYFARREKNLANDKTGKIDGNHRYFIHHLLYVFGLRRSDGVPLMGEGARSWSELMQEIKDSNDGFDGVDIPEWLTSAATSRDTQRKYTELSMQELRDLRMLVEYLYVTGRNKNTLLTSGENIDEVAARMYQNYEEHIGEQDGGKEAHTYMVQLLKPETMLKVIGGKSGAIVDYLYNTLFDAQEKKTEALEENAKRLEVIIGQYYTQKDRRKAWSKKLGINLTDGTELTKENVLSMALNWGNEGNRSRLVAGLSTKTPYMEKDVEEIFAKTMTKKDWAFVQEIWDYLNEHGDAVNEVVEKSAGTPMKRVAPDEFTIEASTGELLTIRGGYYPIRYDPKRSERAADQELATVAESVGGAMAFGSGMGSTKNRANGAPLGRPLDLSLDVMYRHIDQQIHIATMRLACRDVYKLLNHSAVKEPILQTLGKDAYDSLKRWVENTWQEPMNNNLYIETKAEEWRANTVTAIMAFRVSTALLNASNIMPMADRLGTVNAIQAMLQYLRHPQRIRQFVLNDSAFMRNRAHNMDRDLNTKGKDIFGGKNSVRKCLIKYGTWLMEETDMLCSVPTYYWTYQGRYNKEVADGTDEIIARERAHREAHEAVRSIFGSADSIDRSAVQRSQSGLVKAFTPFFSFFNAQMNAVWEKYYAGRYDKHKSSFVERYSGFVRSYLFRFVAMAAIETMIRQSLEAVSAGSGDKKDKDEWYKKFLKQWAANSLGSVASGFPVINMVGEIAQGMITGKLQQGRNSGVVFAAVGRLTDPIQMAYSLQSDKSKIDAIDFGRALTKGIAGTMYAVPDTLTDGFWNTARFMADNYRLNNPDDLREFIAKTILDKKLKQK